MYWGFSFTTTARRGFSHRFTAREIQTRDPILQRRAHKPGECAEPEEGCHHGKWPGPGSSFVLICLRPQPFVEKDVFWLVRFVLLWRSLLPGSHISRPDLQLAAGLWLSVPFAGPGDGGQMTLGLGTGASVHRRRAGQGVSGGKAV